jgi:hypothetical protein
MPRRIGDGPGRHRVAALTLIPEQCGHPPGSVDGHEASRLPMIRGWDQDVDDRRLMTGDAQTSQSCRARNSAGWARVQKSSHVLLIGRRSARLRQINAGQQSLPWPARADPVQYCIAGHAGGEGL